VNGEDCITKSFKFGNPKKDEKAVAWNAFVGGGGEPEGQRDHMRDLAWILKE
jgi:hypothetical protein